MSRSLAAGNAEFAAGAFGFGGQNVVIVHFFCIGRSGRCRQIRRSPQACHGRVSGEGERLSQRRPLPNAAAADHVGHGDEIMKRNSNASNILGAEICLRKAIFFDAD
jgi:hypothetical protein